MDEIDTTSLIAEAGLQPLAGLLRPVLAGLGFELVRLARPSGEAETLQIMAERTGGGDIVVADCAAISRAVGAMLDAHDLVAGAYMLEVSSPGIDRPLTRPRDFAAWAGFAARCVTRAGGPVDGRIAGLGTAGLTLDTPAGMAVVLLANLVEARLVLNDELLQATRKVAPAA